MSDLDLDILLRSPLDDEPERWQGWAGLAAAVVAAAAVFALMALAIDDTPGEVAAPPTTETPRGIVVEETEFPDGFVPVSDFSAYRAEAAIVLEDRIVVPVMMATRRGTDQRSSVHPLGGLWVMETTDGATVSSERVIYDRLRPGAFSVQFPSSGTPRTITLVATFDPRTAGGSADLAYTGTPYTLVEPLTIDLDTGDTYTITELTLGNFLGELAWRVGTADAAIAEVAIELFEVPGTPIGSYFPGPPFLDPVPPGGTIDYIWGPGFNADQDDAATFRLTVTAQLADAAPANVTLAVPNG